MRVADGLIIAKEASSEGIAKIVDKDKQKSN